MPEPSPKVSKLYPWEDYEWYGCDEAGEVAVFTSAGIGPIPVGVLASRAVADSLAEMVWKLPERGGATMLVSLPRPDDYVHFASRGFFAYDWQDVHHTKFKSRRYEMMSRPERPIQVSELPGEFQALVRSVVFSGLRFAESGKVDVRDYFECEPGM